MSLDGIDNATAIAYLNYNDTNDNAEIDILIRVPIKEPGGFKTTRLSATGEQP